MERRIYRVNAPQGETLDYWTETADQALKNAPAESTLDEDFLREDSLETANHQYLLTLRDTNQRRENGASVLRYRFTQDGKVLFEGNDFANSPLEAVDSDATVAALFGFLCLRPGDTDADYFENYTDAQREFAEGDAEELGLLAMERFDPDFVPSGYEVFCMDAEDFEDADPDTWMADYLESQAGNANDCAGWYWWACWSGCLPDGEAVGPFADAREAIADLREGRY